MQDLNKFKKALKKEAIIKSSIYGLSAGFVAIIGLNLLLYFLKATNLLLTLAIGIGCAIIVSMILYLKKYKPNIKTIAKRVDALGLEERAITMIQYQDDESLMASLQKLDAQKKIDKISQSEMRFKIAKSSLIILIVFTMLTIPTLFLRPVEAQAPEEGEVVPPPIIVVPEDPDKEEEIRDIIQDLLDELHKIVDEAIVKQEIKDILNGIIDQLEEDLKQENLTLEEKIEMIEAAREEILRIIKENTIFRMMLAAALKLHPITEALGTVIQERNIEGVEEAMQSIKSSIINSEDRAAAIADVRTILVNALAYAQDEDNLGLIEAIQTFADDLGLLIGIEIETPTEDESSDQASLKARMAPMQNLTETAITDESLDELFNTSTENIKNALMSDEQMEEIGNEIATEIQDALDKLDQIQQGNQDSDEDKEQDERPSIGGNEGDPSEEDTPPVNPDDMDPLDSEKIIDGETPYLEVFEEYYELIIEYLNNNELDDDVREIIETYFEMLK